ncbi:hypothetical protein [Paenibacillus chitinolyticus]|uniref:hypothetical protein n=1 Tax=Paenibacillus chitinolyticus TaxID=79263 RepID=UPI00366D04D5
MFNLDSKPLINLSTFLLKFAEQNITSIEKIHNKYRLKRFVGINIFFPLIVLFILTLVFLSIELNPFISFLPMIILIFTTKIIEKQIGLLIFCISLEVPVMFVIYDLGHSALISFVDNKIISIGALLLVLVFCLLAFLILFGAYQVVKNIIERLNSVSPKLKVFIQLTNANSVTGELLTINRKSDYIIRSNEGNEILVKNNGIATVYILNDSEIILNQFENK